MDDLEVGFVLGSISGALLVGLSVLLGANTIATVIGVILGGAGYMIISNRRKK